MKVVLFCGGLGTRLKEYSETTPKPMVDIGHRPIMWHLMKFYAHYGHREFILCLGYGSEYIKRYFLQYDECLSNDFVMTEGGRQVRLYNSDISDWSITFVETGLNSNLGQRLSAVRHLIGDDEYFMANYADGLSDVNLAEYEAYFREKRKIASFLAVRPSQSFHAVKYRDDGIVTNIEAINEGNLWINGGFFIFNRRLFDYVLPGEELVAEPFARLIAQEQLITYRNPGFWACMDTFKEKRQFDDMYARGDMPWAVWENKYKGNALADEHIRLDWNAIRLDRSYLTSAYVPEK
jgi:glucose-1-phosphate cytidylyltransferase